MYRLSGLDSGEGKNGDAKRGCLHENIYFFYYYHEILEILQLLFYYYQVAIT